MSAYQNKLQDTLYHINNGNENLGFRMLVDAVLDTANMPNFDACIAIADWHDQNEQDIATYLKKCIDLITTLQGQAIHIDIDKTALVQAKNIVKQYGKNSFLLGPINIEIYAGQLIGLVGENGNGKTTLLRMLAKELSITEGKISYPFANKKLDDYTLRTRLTYIPQRTAKWYGKVKDNLKLTATNYGIAPHENEQWVLMMMIRFGLWKFRNHAWEELSSGYKMRFELARTFLRKPKLLLLDEPLANLDILSQQLILEDLKLMGKSLSNPLGIVLSSQQLYEVEKVSDEVVFLQNGKPSSFNNLKNNDEPNNLVVELEIDNTKEELIAALQNIEINEIKLLGSNYYIDVKNTTTKVFLQTLLMHNITVKYFRDISLSTRRFFNK